MKVTKTIEIKFPWTLEDDGHGHTIIFKLKDSENYNFENRFSNGSICEQKIMTEPEVLELVTECYEITRYEPQ